MLSLKGLFVKKNKVVEVIVPQPQPQSQPEPQKSFKECLAEKTARKLLERENHLRKEAQDEAAWQAKLESLYPKRLQEIGAALSCWLQIKISEDHAIECVSGALVHVECTVEYCAEQEGLDYSKVPFALKEQDEDKFTKIILDPFEGLDARTRY